MAWEAVMPSLRRWGTTNPCGPGKKGPGECFLRTFFQPTPACGQIFSRQAGALSSRTTKAWFFRSLGEGQYCGEHKMVQLGLLHPLCEAQEARVT
jgi:hypothetical protein